VATLRDTFGRKASATLRAALSDLQVSLKYARNAHSPDGANLIIQTIGWRTNQQPRANWLVSDLTIPRLLSAIERGDEGPILALRTSEGVQVFERDEATAIIGKLKEPSVKFALERVQIHDLPRLIVTKEVPDAAGGKRYVQREFAKLSLGQQQSVLLALILSTDSNRPLIIDQPEDNLDGEFIYSTLVPVLRRAKERRQVIVVTHNANVAVLGDAEQIVVMKALHDHGEIVARGSIDQVATRDLACAILEGAKEAFLRRAKTYGIAAP
jgi:energy-coupling factor transporter ATP-binding protein EcfA2